MLGEDLAGDLICADRTKVWSLMQLEHQLQPEAYRRRQGGYLDRRRARR